MTTDAVTGRDRMQTPVVDKTRAVAVTAWKPGQPQPRALTNVYARGGEIKALQYVDSGRGKAT